MKINTTLLTRAQTTFARHLNTMNAILAEYRAEVGVTKNFSADYAKERKTEARATAYSKMQQADQTLHDEIKEICAAMRENVNELVTEPAHRIFLDSMSMYNDFQIKMTETEIRAFAAQTLNHYADLRILQKVARNSGYLINIPDVEAIEADIDRIERNARIPSMFIPVEYSTEAQEIGLKIPSFRADGSVATWGNAVTPVYLATLENQHAKLIKDLGGDILKRWNDVQPIVIEALPEAGTDKENLVIAEMTARREYGENLDIMNDETQAAAIEAANAANAKAAEDVLARYTGKK